jgi:hypothetical protein
MYKSILFSIITILFFSACQKKPNASFTFDKDTYKAGDSLVLSNGSSLSNTYRWTLPFGGLLTSKDVRLKLDSNLEAGYYKFKLEAFSKNRKLVDAIEQTIYVSNNINKSSRGYDIMFWATRPSNGNTNPIMVTLNYLTSYIQNLPNVQNAQTPNFSYDLSSNYAVFLNLQEGQYSYTASQPAMPDKVNQNGIVIVNGSAGNIWSGIVDVTSSKMIIKLPAK